MVTLLESQQLLWGSCVKKPLTYLIEWAYNSFIKSGFV